MSSLTQALLSRFKWLSRAGIQAGGKRNLYEVFGYNQQPRHEDFLAKYLRQDVTQRVIHAPVDAIWTDPPVLEGSKAFQDAWKALVDKKIFYYLRQADVFAGLGCYAVLLVGLDDGLQSDQPVNPNRKNKVTYFQPYLEGSVKIVQFDDDYTSPRFGLPTMYQISPGDSDPQVGAVAQPFSNAVVARKTIQVHYTRVLHLADGILESNMYGRSRLEPIYNRLEDLEKIVGGSSETFWLTGNRGMQVDVDKDMELSEEDAKNLSDEIEEYQHQLRRFMRTRGVKVTSLGSDVADPRGPFSVVISLISAATGIPQRVLMGSEAGQLASQQDRANWAQRVSERVANYAQPVVLMPFIDLLINMNVLPEKPTKISWPDAFKLNPFERAQTSAQMARSLVNVARGIQTTQEMDMQLVSIEECRQIVAFDDHMPIFNGLPTGTPIPALPVPQEMDPNVNPLLKKQLEQPTNDLDTSNDATDSNDRIEAEDEFTENRSENAQQG